MKKITKSVLFGWMGMMLFVASCTSPSDISVERETVALAFPIFTSETTVSDLIDEGQDSSALVVYGDNKMGLVYETATQVDIPMPDLENFEVLLQSPITTVPNLPIAGVQIKKAKFDAGVLNFSFINNQYEEHVKIVLRINQFSKNNTILSKTINLNYDGSLPVQKDFSVSLADYNMDVTNSSLQVEYQASLSNGSMASIEQATMEMKDVAFSWLEGIWAEKTFPLEIPTQEIGFFKHYTDGGAITFTNPKLKITALNSVGVTSRLNFNSVGIQTVNNEAIAVSGDFFNDGFNLSYPNIGQIGSTMTSNTEINKANSNIVDVFNAQAKGVHFDVDYVLGSNGAQEGFVAKDSKIDLNMRVELPFEGKVNRFKVSKDFDVKFSNEHVKAATIKLQAVNQIPLDARIQLYFLDNAGIVLDSLVASNGILAIEAASVNPSGDVIRAEKWEEELNIDIAKWERIKNAVNVTLTTSFTSTLGAEVPVNVKANQHVQLNAGLKLVVLP